MNSGRRVSPALAVLASLFNAASHALSQNWVLTTAPNTNWSSVASSADGSKLVATVNGGLIYISTNSGVTWTNTTAPATNWTSVASSADGTELVAAAGLKLPPVLSDTNIGLIYTSGDSGATWAPTTAPADAWSSVATSADGTKLAAVLGSSATYTSANSGASWTSNGIPNPYDYAGCVASSANGIRLVAGGYGVYASTNSGANWQQVGSPPVFYGFARSLASSADGVKLAVAEGALSYNHCLDWVPICTSADAGATWTNTSANTPYCSGWDSIASSADGTKLAAVEQCCGHIFTSTDAGATWISNSVPPGSVACSADGAKFVAAASGGGIYTRQGSSTPVLTISQSAGSLLVSWIVPSTKFLLQQNSNLASTDWAGVTTAPTFDSTTLQYQVSIPAPTGTLFYRLESE